MPSPRTFGRGSDLASPAKPTSDVYVGLLVLSLLAQVAASLFLWMDYSQYPESKPPKVQPPAAIGSNLPAPTGAAPASGAQPTTPAK